MQIGEVLRRTAFNALDLAKGGKLNRLKKVNKQEIVNGITKEYESRRLQAILDYAAQQVPFYREMGEGACLQQFPVMTKMDYNEHKEELLSEEYRSRQDRLFRLSTSGSTGSPFTIMCEGDKMNRVNMNFLSVMELNGFRLGMKRGEFRVWIEGKNTISRWKSLKNNLLMIDISNMGDAVLEKICERIRKQKIQVLVAYSSALTALCGYIRRQQVDVKAWSVEMVFSMGEALPDATYQDIRELFGFAPVRSYGNNENGFIAVQLHEEDRYTADLYNFYIELLKLDSDEPAACGEVGRIVVTDYYNRAFPMIRYDTGDTGVFEKKEDAAGRLHGYFNAVYGRRGSLLYNCKGEPLSIHVFMNVLLQLEGIVHQAKCIQWGEKHYEVLLNADREKIDEKAVLDSYRRYLGEEARIDVTYVDEIPVQASGKRMVCENRWKPL